MPKQYPSRASLRVAEPAATLANPAEEITFDHSGVVAPAEPASPEVVVIDEIVVEPKPVATPAALPMTRAARRALLAQAVEDAALPPAPGEQISGTFTPALPQECIAEYVATAATGIPAQKPTSMQTPAVKAAAAAELSLTPPWEPIMIRPAVATVAGMTPGSGAAASRAARRQSDRIDRQRKDAARNRAAHQGSLAAVTGAIVLSTFMVNPSSEPAEQDIEAGPLRFETGMPAVQRDEVAARGADRVEIEAAPIAITPAVNLADEVPVITVETAILNAESVLEQASHVLATETRTTPETREEIIATASQMRELINVITIGDSPAPADPEVADAVRETLEAALAYALDYLATPEGEPEMDFVLLAEGEAEAATPESLATGALAAIDVDLLDEFADAYEVAESLDLTVDSPEVQAVALLMLTSHLEDLKSAPMPVMIEVEAAPDQFLHFPLASWSVSSPFGYRVHPVFRTWRMHNGVDLRATCGTPVFASAAGTVVTSGWDRHDGNFIVIDHGLDDTGNRIETLYSKLQDRQVSEGESVRLGQQIGLAGRTGTSTGCHLHFEVHQNGERVDPVPWMPTN